MSIVTQHDHAVVGLLRNEEGPVFDKPWRAKAFSLVVHPHRAGLFPQTEWVQTFGEAIRVAPAQPGESVNDVYYRQWAVAVENMVTTLYLTAPDDIARRTQEWRLAYTNMPHDQSTILANASYSSTHNHRSLPLGVPVMMSPVQSSVSQVNNGVTS